MSDIALNPGTAPRALHTPPLWKRLQAQVLGATWRSGLIVALALLWELAPRLGLTDPTFLPPLSEVFAAG